MSSHSENVVQQYGLLGLIYSVKCTPLNIYKNIQTVTVFYFVYHETLFSYYFGSICFSKRYF